MYLNLEICVVRREFLAFNYVTMFFRNKSDDYLYIHICTSEILKTCV